MPGRSKNRTHKPHEGAQNREVGDQYVINPLVSKEDGLLR